MKREIRSFTKFDGLDDDFINLLFFISEEAKIEFKNSLLEITGELGITKETLWTDFMECFPDYISANEIELPFITELFIFYTTTVIVSVPDENIIEIKDGYVELLGEEKLKNYYTAIKLASHNLQVKAENKIEDIENEEKLILNSLSDTHNDLARISILLQLGKSFMYQKNIDKMCHYYNFILTDSYDLSQTTVADFMKVAGEDFYQLGKLTKSLEFFKRGLELNPNLNVKRRLTEINKNI